MPAQIDSLYFKKRPWKAIVRLVSWLFFEGRPLTTRGRWFNLIVFMLFGVIKHIPIKKKVIKPIFILGIGRSGSTILGLVLSMHRSIGFLNEPKALWNTIHSEEDLIGSYSRGKACYRLNAGEVTFERSKCAHRIYGAYLASVFSSRVVDKYPELIFRVPFVKALFPDAKLVFIMRNGWDVCSSVSGWSSHFKKQSGVENHDWWGVDRRKWNLLVEQIVPEHVDLAPHAEEILKLTSQTDMAAVEWIVIMREGMRLLKESSDSVFGLRFETLTQNPTKTIEGLVEFLEIKQDDVFMSYAKSVLHPVKIAEKCDLHPLIRAPFEKTMSELGYV